MIVEIPSTDKTEKLAIIPEKCREFFSFPILENRFVHSKAEMGEMLQ